MRTPRKLTGGSQDSPRGLAGNLFEGDVFVRLLSEDRTAAAESTDLLANRTLFLPLTYQQVAMLARGGSDRMVFENQVCCYASQSVQAVIAWQASATSLNAPAFLLGMWGPNNVPIFGTLNPYFVGSVISAPVYRMIKRYLPPQLLTYPSSGVRGRKDQMVDPDWPYVYLASPLYGGEKRGVDTPRLDCFRLPYGSRVVSCEGQIHCVTGSPQPDKHGYSIATIEQLPNRRVVTKLFNKYTMEYACSIPDRVARSFFKKLGVRLD